METPRNLREDQPATPCPRLFCASWGPHGELLILQNVVNGIRGSGMLQWRDRASAVTTHNSSSPFADKLPFPSSSVSREATSALRLRPRTYEELLFKAAAVDRAHARAKEAPPVRSKPKEEEKKRRHRRRSSSHAPSGALATSSSMKYLSDILDVNPLLGMDLGSSLDVAAVGGGGGNRSSSKGSKGKNRRGSASKRSSSSASPYRSKRRGRKDYSTDDDDDDDYDHGHGDSDSTADTASLPSSVAGSGSAASSTAAASRETSRGGGGRRGRSTTGSPDSRKLTRSPQLLLESSERKEGRGKSRSGKRETKAEKKKKKSISSFSAGHSSYSSSLSSSSSSSSFSSSEDESSETSRSSDASPSSSQGGSSDDSGERSDSDEDYENDDEDDDDDDSTDEEPKEEGEGERSLPIVNRKYLGVNARFSVLLLTGDSQLSETPSLASSYFLSSTQGIITRAASTAAAASGASSDVEYGMALAMDGVPRRLGAELVQDFLGHAPLTAAESLRQVPSACFHNSAEALRVGAKHASIAWRVLGGSVQLSLAEGERIAATASRNEASSRSDSRVAEGDLLRIAPPLAPAEDLWRFHPLGEKLVARMGAHFLRLGDLQMLSTLRGVLSNEISGTGCHLAKPERDPDYEDLWAVADERRQMHHHKSTSPPPSSSSLSQSFDAASREERAAAVSSKSDAVAAVRIAEYLADHAKSFSLLPIHDEQRMNASVRPPISTIRPSQQQQQEPPSTCINPSFSTLFGPASLLVYAEQLHSWGAQEERAQILKLRGTEALSHPPPSPKHAISSTVHDRKDGGSGSASSQPHLCSVGEGGKETGGLYFNQDFLSLGISCAECGRQQKHHSSAAEHHLEVQNAGIESGSTDARKNMSSPTSSANDAAETYPCTSCFLSGEDRPPVLRCCLCLLPVKGLSVICPLCGHGGHREHLKSWFLDGNAVCPSGGCGCFCNTAAAYFSRQVQASSLREPSAAATSQFSSNSQGYSGSSSVPLYSASAASSPSLPDASKFGPPAPSSYGIESKAPATRSDEISALSAEDEAGADASTEDDAAEDELEESENYQLQQERTSRDTPSAASGQTATSISAGFISDSSKGAPQNTATSMDRSKIKKGSSTAAGTSKKSIGRNLLGRSLGLGLRTSAALLDSSHGASSAAAAAAAASSSTSSVLSASAAAAFSMKSSNSEGGWGEGLDDDESAEGGGGEEFGVYAFDELLFGAAESGGDAESSGGAGFAMVEPTAVISSTPLTSSASSTITKNMGTNAASLLSGLPVLKR